MQLNQKYPINTYMISIIIENKKVITKFDTLSSMSLKQFQQLKKSYFKEMSKCVLTLEKLLNQFAWFTSNVCPIAFFNNKLYIINKEVDSIFGRSWMKDLKLELADINCTYAVVQSKFDELLDKYSTNKFANGLGKIPNFEAHLNLRETTQPHIRETTESTLRS